MTVRIIKEIKAANIVKVEDYPTELDAVEAYNFDGLQSKN